MSRLRWSPWVVDFLLGNTQAEPDVPATNDGLIAVVGENVQAQPGTNFRQVVTGGASAIAGSPPNTDRYFEILISAPPLHSRKAVSFLSDTAPRNPHHT